MDKERNYGIIRHMDEFGRIVIPREIRNRLNINPEDAVEINVHGRNISVSKYYPLETLELLCKDYLEAFWKSCRAVCLICSTEHVLANKGLDFSKEAVLSEDVRRYIEKQEVYLYDEHRNMALFGDYKYLVDAIYPIGTKETPMGAVLLLHFREATEKERCCAKLLADMLSQVLCSKERGAA